MIGEHAGPTSRWRNFAGADALEVENWCAGPQDA